MLETMKAALMAHLMEALAALALAGAAAAASWFRMKQAEWQRATKVAVREVEEMTARPGLQMSGPSKRELALAKLKRSAPGLPAERASQLIEVVLPEVRRESEKPPPLPPDSRRPPKP